MAKITRSDVQATVAAVLRERTRKRRQRIAMEFARRPAWRSLLGCRIHDASTGQTLGQGGVIAMNGATRVRILFVSLCCLLVMAQRVLAAGMSAETFSTFPEAVRNSFFRGAFEATEDEYYLVAVSKHGSHDAAVASNTSWSCIRQSSVGTYASLARDRMRQDRNLLPSLAIRFAMADRCGPPDFRGMKWQQ